MHQPHIPQCTILKQKHVHISVYGASCGICLMHCGISEICLLAPEHRSATTMLTRSWLKYRESFHAKHISCHSQLNKWYWRNVERSVIRWFLNYQWFRLLTTIPLYAADIDHIGPVAVPLLAVYYRHKFTGSPHDPNTFEEIEITIVGISSIITTIKASYQPCWHEHVKAIYRIRPDTINILQWLNSLLLLLFNPVIVKF